jgi:hypothetical protein
VWLDIILDLCSDDEAVLGLEGICLGWLDDGGVAKGGEAFRWRERTHESALPEDLDSRSNVDGHGRGNADPGRI